MGTPDPPVGYRWCDAVEERMRERELKERLQNQFAKMTDEEKAERDKCLCAILDCVLCRATAEICFEGEDEGLKCACATSCSGIFYGGITTFCSVVRKSATGLKFGIPALIIGALCGGAICLYKRGYCPNCCESSSASNAVSEPQPGSSYENIRLITTQPK